MAKSAPKAQKRGDSAPPPRKRGEKAAANHAPNPKSASKPAVRAVAESKPKRAAKPAAAKAGQKPPSKPEPKAAARAGAKPERKAAAKSAPATNGKGPKAPAKPPVEKKRNDFAAKVVKMIADEMAVEEAELTNTASFKEDLSLDEVDVAELLMQAETRFDVHPFSEEDWESCETVGDFVGLVQKRVDARRTKKPSGKSSRH